VHSGAPDIADERLAEVESDADVEVRNARCAVTNALEQLTSVLDHHVGDVPADLIIDFDCCWHDKGRDVQRHDLIADQLVDQSFGEEDLLGVGIEASQLGAYLGRTARLRVGREAAKVGEQHTDLRRHPSGRSQLDARRAEVRALA